MSSVCPCSFCTCGACQVLPEASTDEEFVSIRATIASNAASGRRLSELVADQHDLRVAQRRKLQALSENTVNQLLTNVNLLRESQAGLTTQVSTLATQVGDLLCS